MKEIIYLDTDIMNSLLAQLDHGIVDSYTKEQSKQTNEDTSTQSTSGGKAGIGANFKASTGAFPGGSFGFNGSLGSSDLESESSSKAFTEGQRDLLNKIFHDHALNILIEKLVENQLIKTNLLSEELNEGDIINVNGEFDFYDFSLISVASNPDLWEEFLSWDDNETKFNLSEKEAERIYTKINNKQTLTKKETLHQEEALKIYQKSLENKNIINIMKQLEVHSSTTDKLFNDLTFIKTEKLIGLLKKKFLRESTESLSFRGSNSRKATFIGRVIGVKDSVVDGTSEFDFSPQQINKIPNVLLDILLGSFDIIEVGDTLISPIAIFYEGN